MTTKRSRKQGRGKVRHSARKEPARNKPARKDTDHYEPPPVETQLARDPFPFPSLHIRRRPPSIFEYEFEDFQLLNYQAHPSIKAPIAV